MAISARSLSPCCGCNSGFVLDGSLHAKALQLIMHYSNLHLFGNLASQDFLDSYGLNPNSIIYGKIKTYEKYSSFSFTPLQTLTCTYFSLRDTMSTMCRQISDSLVEKRGGMEHALHILSQTYSYLSWTGCMLQRHVRSKSPTLLRVLQNELTISRWNAPPCSTRSPTCKSKFRYRLQWNCRLHLQFHWGW